MQVKDLIKILEKCDGEDEISFIFDDSKMKSIDRGNGLFETIGIDVTALKINGRVALTNGMSCHLIEDDAESIFK